MGEKKAFDRLRADDCLAVVTAGLSALEGRERQGQQASALWREVRGIVGGIVPEVYWPGDTPPTPRSGTILGGAITTPDPQWAVAGLSRLMRKAGVLLAARLDAQGKPEPFVHLPSER